VSYSVILDFEASAGKTEGVGGFIVLIAALVAGESS
jgi:hypothetical protein